MQKLSKRILSLRLSSCNIFPRNEGGNILYYPARLFDVFIPCHIEAKITDGAFGEMGLLKNNKTPNLWNPKS